MSIQFTPTLQTIQMNPNVAWSNSWFSVPNTQGTPLYAQAVFPVNASGAGNTYVEFGKRNKSVVGAAKVSLSQNIYEADFEYGLQPLRWEILTSSQYGTATVKQLPGIGGVLMQILSGGDLTIRQSRPYHRYQPGKSMYMATATNFGGPYAGQYQRVGFFDDANGMFFEQGTQASTLNSTTSSVLGLSYVAAVSSNVYATSGINTTGLNTSLSANNPAALYVCWRSDINPYGFTGGASSSIYTDYKVSFDQWSDPSGVKNSINWNDNQMLWLEYSWYGAGCLRWGILLGGEPYILHEQTMGNLQQFAWCRTGNLPVRYEQRDTTFTNTSANFMHYGVSVIVEGQRDPQRGFTYAYGNSATVAVPANRTSVPLMSFRPRTMGVVEYNSSYAPITSNPAPTNNFIAFSGSNWATNQLVGRAIYFPTLSSTTYPNGYTAKISANNATSLSFVDVVTLSSIPFTPSANIPYQIGLIDRGQILPQDMFITSNGTALVQLIASTPTNPIKLTGANFQPLSASGSSFSFAELDLNATAVTGGEVVYGFLTPSAGTVQDVNLSNFFPLYNNIRGNTPDILTVAVTTTQAVTAGVHIVGQEAMS